MPDAAQSTDAIAVVTIDRLPGWMLPAFGCAWVAMPNLDALAGRGLILDRVIATSNNVRDTLVALAGGAQTTVENQPWPLFAAATDQGWPTAVVTDDASIVATPPPHADICLVAPFAATEPAASENTTNLGKLFDAAANLVRTGNHRFVWCHASSLGTTWDAPNRYRDRYIDPDDPPPPSGVSIPNMTVDSETDPDTIVGIRHVFAGQLTLLDHWIGKLLDAISSRQGRWTILVSGVRGLGLGLHGVVGCRTMPPYGEAIHLPSILVDHRDRMAGQRYGGLVIPDDLGATLIELFGHPPRPSTDPSHGRSLSPLLDAWQGPDRDRVVSSTPRGTAIATPAWHLVLPAEDGQDLPRARLFSKPDDYFEVCDVADRCPAVAEELSMLAADHPQAAWTAPLSSAALNGI